MPPNPPIDSVSPTPLDATVMSRLRTIGNRARRYVLVEGIAWMLAFLLVAIAIQLLLDYSTQGLQWSMRATLSATILGGAAWLLWRRAVLPLRRQFGPAEMAKLIERRYPELSSILISAVRFSAGQVGPSTANSRSLMAASVVRAGKVAGSLDFNAVLNPTRAKRSALFVLFSLIVVATAVGTAPEIMGLWFARNVLLQNVDWPKRTHLFVDMEGEELIGARGDDLVVQGYAKGVQPRSVHIGFESASGVSGYEVMVTVGSAGSYTYRYTFSNVEEDFEFYLEGGDDRTQRIRARILDRPRVTQTSIRIVPPAYTGLDTMDLEDDQRSAQLLQGSTVTIAANMNKPVTHATLVAGRDTIGEANLTDQSWTVTFSPTQTHTYHFALTDEVGLNNKRPVRFSLRVVPDEPPRARMKLVGVGSMITPEAVLPIELEFADTYGLASAEIGFTITREGSSDLGTIPLPSFTSSTKTFSASLSWAVALEAVVPGDTLTLQATATDFNDVTGPGEATSPETVLRVVTRDELLAELARREQEYRSDFERLIDSQEQLRSALLTVIGRANRNDKGEHLAVMLTPLERRQRNITSSVNVIRQQFEMIFAELGVNRLDSAHERDRLGERIVKPLTRLAKRELVAGADIIRQWSRRGTAERASLVDPQQVEILSQMRSVLENMIEWEGYQEVVSMLRDIIRLQQELQKETKTTLQEQGHDIFDNQDQ